MINDGQVNYSVAFTELLIENFATPIDAWSYDELVLLRTYVGRELSARHPEEIANASTD